MDIKLRKDFLADVEAAVVSAERKHPKICDFFVNDSKDLLKALLELVQRDNDYFEETGKSEFFKVIREELIESALAFQENKYNDCINELAQVAAVAVRGMEFVYRLTPEAKASEKYKGGNND